MPKSILRRDWGINSGFRRSTVSRSLLCRKWNIAGAALGVPNFRQNISVLPFWYREETTRIFGKRTLDHSCLLFCRACALSLVRHRLLSMLTPLLSTRINSVSRAGMERSCQYFQIASCLEAKSNFSCRYWVRLERLARKWNNFV